MRLLVFDDDPAIGRLVGRIAAMAGFEAKSVTEAEAFSRSLRDNRPHVIVLDLQLGRTDGVEQLRFLAEQQYTGSLILASGFDPRVLSTAGALGQSLGLHIAATLTKPIGVDELDVVLNRLRSLQQPVSPGHLLRAVRDDELCLDFQPIVTRNPRALKKLEALVRWDHPTLGRIAPDDFMAATEANPTIIDAVTDWVIGAALDAYLVLREFGVRVPIAVNISAQNLHDLTLPERLEQRLRVAGVPAEHLCLEVTESVAFQDAGRTMDVLTRLRLKGVSLSLDDFGTGYSSLKVLRQMPFSEIKIDRSFVADIATSRDAKAIVKSIVDLAANMEMDSVAEGVETEETAALLESWHVGAMQGFLMARPMPIENVPAWLGVWTGREVASGTHLANASSAGACSGNATALAAAPEPRGEGASASEPPKLSGRQLDVMQLLTEGCSVKEIARRLDIGIGTVKVHLSAAYIALGAHNRVEAVMRAGLTPTAGGTARKPSLAAVRT